MYGLPKVHKEGIPLRPILAAYSAPSCKLAKFLLKFIQPYTRNQYTLNNSFDFKQLLSSLNFQHEIYLVSFDISSLFTNVPVKETVDIAVQSVFNGIQNVGNISKKLFRKLLELVVSDNRFLFNNEHIQQHEGFAMGSPLSAPMANLFLAHHEVKWLDECPDDFKPLLYRRYVDDTFMVFRRSEQIEQFFNFMNQRHPNIRFTKEYEVNGILNFLDLKVEKIMQNNLASFRTSVFRKLTFTGLGLNFHSFTFFNFKINGIKTLLHRAFTLSDSWLSFHHEILFLLNYFKSNGYPEQIFYKVLRNFIKKKFSNPTPMATVDRMKFYVKLPFISNASSSFIQSNFNRFLRSYFPHIDFRFLFLNNYTIQGLLKHKDTLPDALSSGLVYKYESGACGSTYIGQTQKALRTRVGDHLGVSSRTGCLLARPTQSAVRNHLEICSGTRSIEEFKKVRCFNDILLQRIYESLEIHFKKPILNQDGSSVHLFLL